MVFTINSPIFWYTLAVYMSYRRIPFLMRTLDTLASEMDFQYHIDREVDDFGYLEFSNGVRHYVSRADIRINLVGPHDIASHKYQTDIFLSEAGYPVIPSKIFYSEALLLRYGLSNHGYENAVEYAAQRGYPLMVKPNNGLQGNDVHKVFNEQQLRKTLLDVFSRHNRALVQEFISGIDCRIIIYKGTFISAYQRIPLTVVGDGKQSILQMLETQKIQAQKNHSSLNFDMNLIKKVLRRKRKSLNSIPAIGEEVILLDNANLSTGGRAIDVTDIIHPGYIEAAIKATQTLNLSLAGIDILTQGKINEEPQPGMWHFLEVNASPGFDWYSRLGNVQHERILNLFRRILEDIKHGVFKP